MRRLVLILSGAVTSPMAVRGCTSETSADRPDIETTAGEHYDSFTFAVRS